ncbi:MAG: 5-formyltetrahydrofolate cyclo-ligase [Betaproteobacteria bacterium]|nr:5-formyltetrahydrofolate cyclo-ligase [Betaproteobacteria bacterium]
MPRTTPAPDKPTENSAVHPLERSALRQEKVAAREALSPSQHRCLSEAIAASLGKLLQQCPPRILGFCWPIRAEFDCRPLVEIWRARGAQSCLPKVSAPGTALEFRAWRPDSEMLRDRYGIPYPATGEILFPDVLLLPVNAFDAAGYRLGYGAGYFDRTLAQLTAQGRHPLTIGVGFELARVDSIHPAPHDIPLDAVVTEGGIAVFSSRIAHWPQ